MRNKCIRILTLSLLLGALFVIPFQKNFGDSQSNQIKADVPKFSVKRGFYQNYFNVKVSSDLMNAVINYTLDGSEPRTSKTAVTQISPATILVDPSSTSGQRPKSPAFIIRAYVTAPGFENSESVTHTYIFVDDAVRLSPDNVKPGADWPNPTKSANPQTIDYGLDPNVYLDQRYKELIDDALLAIPSISIATDLNNLFSLSTGIYMNAMSDGKAWERPASIELINPDGSDGFQINAGLRIRGGYSRHGENPKHAFRLFFSSAYGEGNLHHPLFGKEGADEFDKLDLRTSQNYSWSYPGHQGEYNIMIRDVFSRDLQRDMGRPYTRSRFYHLYLNGVYWGLFQTQERPEAYFAQTYLGGFAEDYDVVKVGDNYIVEATDGNMDAYKEIWNLCVSGFKTNANYFKLLGFNSDGTRNYSGKVLVDQDNLIDYMLVIFFAGNFDAPTSKFGSNKGANNFYAIYNRNGKEGFKFFAHDAEHGLRTTAGEGAGIGLYENRVNIGTLNDGNKMTVSSINAFHPQWLHFKLSDNTEYKIRFADQTYKHFFNEGCMTPSKTIALFQSRAKEIETAIIGESVRWGDSYYEPPRNKFDDWLPAVNDIVKNYFPVRTNIVLNQLKEVGLYPSIDPPIYKNNEQVIYANSADYKSAVTLKLSNPNNTTGTIFYTLDGSDPRMIGGAVSVSAIDGGDEILTNITSTAVVKARVQNGSTWSALHELTVFVNNSTQNLKLTEIHYHPLDGVSISGNEYEFIELKNIGITPINLSQSQFVNGIAYTFPQSTIIEPNKFIVLASNKLEFNRRYSFLPFDEYTGQLDNGGERISLITANSDTIFSIRYNDKAPWPITPDTAGYSLVTKDINPTGDLNDPLNWRASYNVNGSPGKDDVATSIEGGRETVPHNFELYQNYPNPFNPSTIIRYSLPTPGFVALRVYDVLGREISTLVNEYKQPGIYSVEFRIKSEELNSMFNTLRLSAGKAGSSFASGIYFYTLQIDKTIQTRKMMLIK